MTMIAFSIFGFSVYWYGIFYAVAFFLGYGVLNWIGQQKFFAQDSKIQHFLTEGIDDLLMLIVLGVLI